MKIVFGIPLKIKRKIEKYPKIGILTMEAAPVNKGATYRFILNKKAVEFLTKEGNLDLKKVSFSFDEGKIFIANTTYTDLKRKDYYRVTIKHIFSNKKVYEYIVNILNLDNTKEYEFKLEKVLDETVGDTKVFELILVIPEVQEASIALGLKIINN